jgi:hypothetical protein
VKTALRDKNDLDAPRQRSPEDIAERTARLNAILDPLHREQRESGIRLPTHKDMDELMYD